MGKTITFYKIYINVNKFRTNNDDNQMATKSKIKINK